MKLQTEGGEGRTLYFLADSYSHIFCRRQPFNFRVDYFYLLYLRVPLHCVECIDGKDTPPTPLVFSPTRRSLLSLLLLHDKR